ncbi:MAG: hypothetical protein UV74_C0013G0411 [Candidatus Woesebacteria bacterium GW2011_GWB1_43_14]|uniref:Uncharacterized protein n=1 Tax=Candidatus Woesebacteria bacterium GW2011_GWB1_43_14 TaxID=1618578 RepID=A0A0G1DHW9_9BACT|nr:MAG: hypothetical protein UT21_C0001G0123 [Candidatus Woesebacteria bacterium GW2011_GWA1_39_11b]KKS78291.1 MAG: hypothetical protein UV51_C0001G0007 [Candidatus Woesebacteria bacterium GW2011_GWC1_42_9]KKS97289.1 MAG: hypothetical protein UV74_C0013G0411 [Candidatus Woesebacteria bacterium GW2011_GWB1_43_14]
MKLDTKVIVINIINAVLVVVSLYLIVKLPVISSEINSLRSEQVVRESQSDYLVQKADIENNQSKISRLQQLFADDTALIQFVTSIDELREQGLVVEFSFLTNSAVDDKSGNQGIPILIKFQGDMGQINSSILEIEKLPYLLRPIDIELTKQPEGDYIFSYGAFLYLNSETKL